MFLVLFSIFFLFWWDKTRIKSSLFCEIWRWKRFWNFIRNVLANTAIEGCWQNSWDIIWSNNKKSKNQQKKLDYVLLQRSSFHWKCFSGILFSNWTLGIFSYFTFKYLNMYLPFFLRKNSCGCWVLYLLWEEISWWLWLWNLNKM